MRKGERRSGQEKSEGEYNKVWSHEFDFEEEV